MGAPCMAVVFAFFTLIFIAYNQLTQNTSEAAATAGILKRTYATIPWREVPVKKYIDEVNQPFELQLFLLGVFAPATYGSYPEVGNSGFCTDWYPCDVGEGTCDTNNQCSGTSVCGTTADSSLGAFANGEYWTNSALTAECNSQGASIDWSTLDADQPCVSSGDTCCSVNGTEITQLTSCASSTYSSCCVATESFNHTNTRRPVYLGAFNEVLAIRFSMKRYRVQKIARGHFRTTTPVVLASESARIYPDVYKPDIEDESDIEGDSNTTWRFSSTGGYQNSGGFIIHIDPADGKASMTDILTQMTDAGWFDVRLGSFVVDMMTYNRGTDLTTHFAMEWAFTSSGTSSMSFVTNTFNLNLNDLDQTLYLVRFIMELVITAFIVFFYIVEFQICRTYGSILVYIRMWKSITDQVGLGLCSTVLIYSWIMRSLEMYTSVDFRVFASGDLSSISELFTNLEDLGSLSRTLTVIVGANLLVTMSRAVQRIAMLESNLGVVFATIASSFTNLLFFTGVGGCIFTGFSFFAHFAFGHAIEEFSRWADSFMTCFKMLAGDHIFDRLYESDPYMAVFFFYVFCVFWYFVMLNMFISILMNGFDIVDHGLINYVPQNPIVLIVDDFKKSVFNQVWNGAQWFKRLLTRCAHPGKAAVLDMVQCCLPYRFSCKFSLGLPKPRKSATPTKAREHPFQDRRGHVFEFSVMTALFANYLVFMFFQTNGNYNFNLSESVRHQLDSVSWTEQDPHRHATLDQVTTMEGVYYWVNATLPVLYGDPECMTDPATYGTEDVATCDWSDDTMQLVNKVASWNHGFLNTTFLRLTIQYTCFRVAGDDRFSTSPAHNRMENPNDICATSDCNSVLDEACYTSDGTLIDVENMAVGGTGSQYNYNFSNSGDLGSYEMNGGFAVSFGQTLEEAQSRLNELVNDKWFSRKSVSMVFDFLLYNGNIDIFSRASVAFSLRRTGKLVVDITVDSLPLNLFEGGGPNNTARTATLVLFIFYLLFIVYFILETIALLLISYLNNAGSGKPWYQFIVEHFSDTWRFGDIVSLLISIVSLVQYIVYMTNVFVQEYEISTHSTATYQVPNDDVSEYGMPSGNDVDRPLYNDWYLFSRFESVSNRYFYFLTIAALNAFFISIKVVKFLSMIERVKVYSDTLYHGRLRTLYFVIVIGCLMVGFAVMVQMIFGSSVEGVSTVQESFEVLFLWLLGTFDNLDDLRSRSVLLGSIVFVMHMVFFYFISVNMFLATMIKQYSRTVSEHYTQKERNEVERNRTFTSITYDDLKAVRKDMKLRREDDAKDGEAVIESVGEKAQKAGLSRGHVLYKVNGDKDIWKTKKTEDIIDKADRFKNYNNITLVFRQPPPAKSEFEKWCIKHGLMSDKEHHAVQLKATVKNFWINHGAVTWTFRDAQNSGRNEEDEFDKVVEEEEVDDEDEGAREDPAAMQKEREELKKDDVAGGSQNDHSIKQAKKDTKKKLETLLFTRQTHDSTLDQEHDTWQAAEDQDPDMTEEKMDIDELRKVIEDLSVTGEEAWLDCLITAIEQQQLDMDETSVVTDLLRTNEMQEMATRGKNTPTMKENALSSFFQEANNILTCLEHKAKKMYYIYLEKESLDRQETIQRQNEVFHDYICELETHFKKVMGSISSYNEKKKMMLEILNQLLGRDGDKDSSSVKGGKSSRGNR